MMRNFWCEIEYMPHNNHLQALLTDESHCFTKIFQHYPEQLDALVMA